MGSSGVSVDLSVASQVTTQASCSLTVRSVDVFDASSWSVVVVVVVVLVVLVFSLQYV
jgi:hypothetical protein